MRNHVVSAHAADPAAAVAGSRTARWLALGAIAGPGPFTLAWLVLGVRSPGSTVGGGRSSPSVIPPDRTHRLRNRGGSTNITAQPLITELGHCGGVGS